MLIGGSTPFSETAENARPHFLGAAPRPQFERRRCAPEGGAPGPRLDAWNARHSRTAAAGAAVTRLAMWIAHVAARMLSAFVSNRKITVASRKLMVCSR